MRLLIISPHFPPINTADLHRVRLLIPHWHDAGLEIHVLTVQPDQVIASRDERMTYSIPPQIVVHRATALGKKWAKIPGLGSIAFRAKRAMARLGDQILSSKKFDLIYFSTTVFPIHALGPVWKKKFGVPFVMDYQDPWVNDYYREHPGVVPPGGRLKYGVMDFLHRRMEPIVLMECSGITAVSAAYPVELARRYPWAAMLPHMVQPFPGDILDLQVVIAENIPQSIFSRNEGLTHWVYAGMTNAGMDKTITAFFRALAEHAPQDLKERLRIHFLGTCYGGNADTPPVVKPLAEQFGLSGIVNERPERIPYSEVLACLRDADALLVFGSNDVGYTASKIYPYLLAEKPLLTVFHEASSVVSLIRRVGGSVCVSFTNEDAELAISARIAESWIEDERFQKVVPLNQSAFEPYTAKHAARAMLTFFESLIA
jgi:hypothetical protein